MGKIRRRAGAVALSSALMVGLVATAPGARAEQGAGADSATVDTVTFGVASDSTVGDARAARSERAARSALLATMRPANALRQVGGAVTPMTGKDAVTVDFAGPGERRVTIPSVGQSPTSPGGVFVTVTATAPASGSVEVSLNGDRTDRWTPAVVADSAIGAGRLATSSTIVAAATQMWVRSSGATTVRIQTIAWVSDDRRSVVSGGGVGIATDPAVAFSTEVAGAPSAGLIDALASDEGVGVYVTGSGGIPAQSAQLVFVQVEATPLPGSRAPALQGLDPRGRWQTLARFADDVDQSQLVAVLVDDVGFVRLRASAAMNVRMTPVGWISRGAATEAPEDRGAVVPLLGDTIAVGSADGDAQTWREERVQGIPQAGQALTAVLTGIGVGQGTVRIDGGRLGDWSVRRVDGVGSSIAFVPDAQRGVTVSASGEVDVQFRAVAYVLTQDPSAARTEGTPRSGPAPVVRITDPVGASREQRQTGRFTLSGTVRGGAGIAEVRVRVPGVRQRPFALVDNATGRWSIDLRLPAGTTQVAVTASDLQGRSSTARVQVTVASDGRAPQIAPDLLVLGTDLQRRLAHIAPGYLDFVGAQAPAVVPGGVVTAAPFRKSPDGLLRKVDTLRQIGPKRWRVYTSRAGLADAVVQGELGQRQQAPRILRGNPLVVTWDHAFPVDIESDDVFDAEESESTDITVQAALKARLLVAGRSTFAIGLDIITKWGIVPVGVDVTYFEYTFANRIRLVTDDVQVGVSDGAVVAIDKPLGKPLRFSIPVVTGVAITGGFTPTYQLLLNGSLELTGEASVRTNLRFIYDSARGGWQEVQDDWLTEPQVSADLTFSGNSVVGLGGAIDAGINDVGGVRLEWMLGIIGVKGQATLRVRSGLTDQPDEIGLNCDAGNSDLEVFSTFKGQIEAFFERQSWPIVRLEPWRQVWYSC